MTDSWDFYFARVNDALSSVAVNMTARASAPDPTRPQLLWIWLAMRAPRPDGLSSAEEAPVLGDIEDELAAILEREASAISVGRITGSARREFYYYAPQETPLDAIVDRALARHAGYTASCGQQPDPEWSQYLDLLYPSPREYQRMQNRHVLQALADAGDIAEQPRPIEHWAYFAQAAARDDAARRLTASGFELTEQTTATDTPRPFGLRFCHHGPATQERVDEATWRILDALGEADAEYDGWESPVMGAPKAKGVWGRLFGGEA